MREWEEEQTQLDRDWYMANEDGTLVSIPREYFLLLLMTPQMGDEEHNPLAQWEDLEAKKQAEIAAKQVVGAPS